MTTLTADSVVEARPVIAARTVDATKVYGRAETEVRALDGITVDFAASRFTIIMGPSGSGKSTLLHCIAGLDTLTSGHAYIGEEDLSTLDDRHLTMLRRDRIGFVFQAYNLVPTLTALENVTLPLRLAGRKGDQEWIRTVIDTMGLANRRQHRPSELSGGQQQRVAVARAPATRPQIIFGDEPTGNLDSRSSPEVLTFIRRAVDEMAQTIVIVTHDPKVATLPEVRTVSGLRQGLAQVDGKSVLLQAADPKTVFGIMKVDPLQGSTADLGSDAIAVYKNVAKDKGWTVGSRVSVVFGKTGRQTLRVALIYGENAQAGNYLLGLPAYQVNFSSQFDSKVLVKQAPGVSAASAVAAVKRAAQAYPGVKVLDRAQYKSEQTKPLDRLLALVYALLGLAIIIALLGITNMLARSITERVRELGLLRAVGMTRSQLRSAIRWESVIIALQGTVLGLVIGAFFGWAMVTAMRDQGITVFRLPLGTLAVVVVLASIAGIIAAVPPSRHAAKLDVLRAVVSA
jgi:putative ABC transport system ATP-binding protein